MTSKEYSLSLWERNYAEIPAVQGEAQARTVNIHLMEEVSVQDALGNLEIRQKPVDITGYSTPRLYIEKSDKTKVFFDGTIADAENGQVSFVLPYQATTAAGENSGTVYMTKPDGTTLKAIGLTLNVQANDLEGAAESTSEFSALVTALGKADAAAEQTEQAKTDSETAVANANTAIGNIDAKNQEITAAESARVTSENGRVTAESARVLQENARKTAETTRQSQEGTRQSQESTRQTNETARGAAETTRSQHEDTRNGNEAARKTAEQDRAAAEADRQTHEADRRNVEDVRVGAEQNRATAETARAAAETTRQQQETTRQTQETGRVNAESARVTAENKCQTDTQTAISGANTARDSANTAADRANTAAQNAEDAISGQLDPAIDARIAAKTGVAGGIAGYDSTASQLANKSLKSSISTATLPASGWTGSAAPYSYALSVAAVTATSANELLPGASITADQLDALQSANIQDGGQAAGHITLLAYGDKPGIDLPVRVIVRGDL